MLFCVFSLNILFAQEVRKPKKVDSSEEMKKSEEEIQIALVVGAIVSNVDHQKLRNEMGANSKYIPHKYLNILEKGFDRPNYTGVWEQDLILFKEAISKWKRKSPDVFSNYLKSLGLG